MAATASQVIQTLTNYASGLAQDRMSAVAEFLAPTVPVGNATGFYKQFNEKNAFQKVDTARAIGGPAKRLEFQATDATYNCTPQALEIAIDDQERDLSGEGDPLGIERAKVDTLLSTAAVSHEDKVLTAVKAAITAVGSRGVWSDLATNDPVKELDEQIKAIAVETGKLPNRIVFGIGAWFYFRNHAKTHARMPGAAAINVSLGAVAAMLLNPSIEIKVGVLSTDIAKTGATKSAANIVGDEVFIFHANHGPTLYDPSFMKTFRTRRGGVQAVRIYRDDKSRSDIVALDWSEDVELVSANCARRLTIT